MKQIENGYLRKRLAQVADEIEAHMAAQRSEQREELISALKERADDLLAITKDAQEYSMDGLRDYVMSAGVDLIRVAYGRVVA